MEKSPQQESWRRAMDEEFNDLKLKNVWKLTKLPPDKQLLGCRWVYNLKRDENGKVIRYKARLVAQVWLKWKHFQCDVTGAYLYAPLNEEVYMKQPQGYIEKGKEGLVCKLKQALYGLHQSGRAWYFELNNVLNEIGLQKLNWCNCTYLYGNSIVLLVYVDDIVIFGQTEKDIDDVLIKLKGKFNLKIMGEISKFVDYGSRVYEHGGMEITWLDNLMNECASRDVVNYRSKPVLLADNQAAIDFLKSPIENYRTKHIEEFRSGMTTKMAVNDVSLNIYQGQITALLGHNGAGKTTTINILTGLYTPTSGTASINGLDILTDTVRARRGLGVCPQHNVLYDTLTVEEHLKIYAAMKGVEWKNLNAEVTQTLNIVKLAEKRTELIKNLSGGMKRKLSLGIAIVGGSKVLFLDEPTSGMDVEARRSVWDALLEIRHSRTIILTTHYMEEADILGDRIAIMAEGEIQCCGSPMFLKQKFGTGYHLHVVKDSHFDIENLFSLLKRYIPDVKIGKELEKEISFSLSSNTGSGFGDMFEELENRKQKLGVTSFGVTITTMEDVFLNVANLSDMKYKLRSESENGNGVHITMEDVYGGSPGLRPHPRFSLQFFALVMKRIHYSKRHWSILIAQLAIPFLLTCMCLYFLGDAANKNRITYDPLKLDISSVYGDTDGFLYNKNPELSQITESLKNVLESNKVNVRTVDNPTHYVLDYGKKDISKFLKNIMVGGAIDVHGGNILNLTAWYNGEPYHTTPMSLLLMHTAVLKYITNTGSITLINEPLPQLLQIFTSDIMSMMSRVMSIVFMPLALGFLSASFILVPIHERTSKSKLLQLMTGVPAVIYWIATFVWDYLVWIVVSFLLIIPFAIFSHYAFFGIHSNAIGK
ncbi:ATP-binding cassette sub-family A member 3 [Trichonephila clavipes]|nr:ATP-binding cassette sub-family A member 3 [Trichonephila clavipes]